MEQLQEQGLNRSLTASNWWVEAERSSIFKVAADKSIMQGEGQLEAFINFKKMEGGNLRRHSVELSEGKAHKEGNDSMAAFKINLNLSERIGTMQGDTYLIIDDTRFGCEILSIEYNSIRLKIANCKLEGKISGRLVFDNSHIIKKQIKALEELKQKDYWSHYLFGNKLLKGAEQVKCVFGRGNPRLNERQQQAVRYAVGVNDVYLVWGPPGTGKTSIVPSIVKNYFRLNPGKMLVCSYTNKAVDNIVARLFKDFKGAITRFGPSTLPDKYREVFFGYQVDREKNKLKVAYGKAVKSKETKKRKLEERHRKLQRNLDNARRKVIIANRKLIAIIEEETNDIEKRLSGDDPRAAFERLRQEKEELESKLKTKEMDIDVLERGRTGILDKLKSARAAKSRILSAVTLKGNRRTAEMNVLEGNLLSTGREIGEAKEQLKEFQKQQMEAERLFTSAERKFLDCEKTREIKEKLDNCYDGLKRLDIGDNFNEIYEQLSELLGKNAVREAKGIIRGYRERETAMTVSQSILKKLASRISDLTTYYDEKLKQVRLKILQQKSVIITTNLRASQKDFEDIKFDLVIMDEAGSIDVPSAVIPLLKTEKAILIGDHHQLGPIIQEQDLETKRMLDENKFLKKSIFEWFHNDHYGIK
ncbi:AAA family ATPase, partial [Candidatus Woesearchaeota archaeon]|nr:AAA family ATPase [Candidatus Woesearchaeota archaeon]